ncbi:MAG: hypothetical protein RSG52_08405 [Terrisporobacter sp.]|uniref:hypothetical protein n=1 Tax=Clostridia TaxID=186801 RepID=UPI002FC60D27
MNKKRLYILSLLLSLMVVIICMQQLFSKDIKKVALRNNGVKSFSEYNINEGDYKISLPENWLIEEGRENIGDKELEVNFNSDKVEGNIKILNKSYSMEEVDTKIFNNVNNKKHYKYNRDGLSWNVIDYEVKENSNTFRNKCYVRKYSEGKVILINFKYNDSKSKPSIEVVFEEIVNNFR